MQVDTGQGIVMFVAGRDQGIGSRSRGGRVLWHRPAVKSGEKGCDGWGLRRSEAVHCLSVH